MKSSDEKPTKKPYHSPELVVYGDIRELTQTLAKGARDAPPPQAGGTRL